MAKILGKPPEARKRERRRGFQTSSFWNDETVDLCCLKSSSLWHFVMIAIRN